MRVGILGGTFDPIHYGHLMAAEEARVALQLARVLFVPAGHPPHKLGQPVSPVQDRIDMVERAIADNPAFALSRVDADRPGPSYSVEMVRRLRDRYGADTDLYFIIGMDSLIDLPRWHRPAELIDLCRLVVLPRPGYTPDLERLIQQLPGLAGRVIFLDVPPVGIASSDIQRRVREGRSIRYQVPEAVAAYIRERGLYRGDEKLP